ncbi:hypothetical protein GCM10020229_57930 [Kitasatospora albolonga]
MPVSVVPGGKPAPGSAVKTPGDQEGETEHGDQPGCPDATGAAAQGVPQPGGARKDEQAGEQEEAHLDPAERAEAELAEGVAGEVEALPGQALGQAGGEEDRPGGDGAHQEERGRWAGRHGGGGRRRRGQCLGHGGGSRSVGA